VKRSELGYAMKKLVGHNDMLVRLPSA